MTLVKVNRMLAKKSSTPMFNTVALNGKPPLGMTATVLPAPGEGRLYEDTLASVYLGALSTLNGNEISLEVTEFLMVNS